MIRRRRVTWKEIRRRHPERMAAHLESLNRKHKDSAAAREMRLTALLGVMPDGPMPSWELRDELSQAWSDVYGKELTSKEAWLEVRFGIRRGVFLLTPDGRYAIMRNHGARQQTQEDAPRGVGGLPVQGDSPGHQEAG